MELVSRNQWGALPATGPLEHRRLEAITAAVIHYADAPVAGNTRDEVAAVRGIQHYHQHHKGWSDIGYHALVGMSGAVYQGRTIETVGAHCEGFNTPSIGLCFLTAGGITPAAGNAAIQWLQLVEFAALHHKLILFAHSEKRPTFCPGDRIAHWVNDVRGPDGQLK